MEVATSVVGHKSMGSRPELPALTGLRFCAAFFVLLGHADAALFRLSPEPWLLKTIAGNLLSLGMSLFFVLSGFVIHYNYVELVSDPKPQNIARFLTARFARLYPLYLLVLVIDVGLGWKAADIPAIPYYLSMTQSWVYGMWDGHTLIGHLRFSAVTWSISTEWFLYCCYPLIVLGVGTDRSRLIKRTAMIAIILMSANATAHIFGSQIEGFAGSVWGSGAVGLQAGNDRFILWLLNYSPFARLHEFVVGIATAQTYLLYRDQAPSRTEARIGSVMLYVSVAVIVRTSIVMRFMDIAALCKFIVTLSLALLLFCCARYHSFLSTVLSSRPIVAGGDASYSIYLFHIAVIQSVAIPVILSATMEMQIYVAVRFLISASFIILISLGTHRVFEVPLRVAIRSGYTGNRNDFIDRLVILFLICAPIGCCMYGWINITP